METINALALVVALKIKRRPIVGANRGEERSDGAHQDARRLRWLPHRAHEQLEETGGTDASPCERHVSTSVVLGVAVSTMACGAALRGHQHVGASLLLLPSPRPTHARTKEVWLYAAQL